MFVSPFFCQIWHIMGAVIRPWTYKCPCFRVSVVTCSMYMKYFEINISCFYLNGNSIKKSLTQKCQTMVTLLIGKAGMVDVQ